MEIINEASKPDYTESMIETLPIGEFRERFARLPFRDIVVCGLMGHTVEDEVSTKKLNSLEKGVVRYIPFGDNASFVDSAVIFDDNGEPVMDFKVYISHFLGSFYMSDKSSVKRDLRGVNKIYAESRGDEGDN